MGDGTYDADADVIRNGTINAADATFITGSPYYGQSRVAPPGDVSPTAVDCIVGYCGYIFDPSTQMYCVRFRWYEPNLGRWVSRDPIEYIDGSSLYESVRSSPHKFSDSTGLYFDPFDQKGVDREMEKIRAAGGRGYAVAFDDWADAASDVLPAIAAVTTFFDYAGCMANCLADSLWDNALGQSGLLPVPLPVDLEPGKVRFDSGGTTELGGWLIRKLARVFDRATLYGKRGRLGSYELETYKSISRFGKAVQKVGSAWQLLGIIRDSMDWNAVGLGWLGDKFRNNLQSQCQRKCDRLTQERGEPPCRR